VRASAETPRPNTGNHDETTSAKNATNRGQRATRTTDGCAMNLPQLAMPPQELWQIPKPRAAQEAKPESGRVVAADKRDTRSCIAS
jgi:hypothetical protein